MSTATTQTVLSTIQKCVDFGDVREIKYGRKKISCDSRAFQLLFCYFGSLGFFTVLHVISSTSTSRDPKNNWKGFKKGKKSFLKGTCAKKDLLKVNSVAGGRNQFKIQKSLERASAEPSPDKTSSRLVSRHRPDRNPAERCTAVASGKKQDKEKSDRILESLLAVE